MAEEYTDDPTCPYCHESYQAEGPEDYEAEGFEVECPSCSKKFLLTAEHSVTFSSRRIDCEGAHEWSEPEEHEIDQGLVDRWNKKKFLNKHWEPHNYWQRDCKNCEKYERSEYGPLGAPCPEKWLVEDRAEG